ncbi:DUF4123 domain-containing protein [Gammaproteobacteria bacterium AS21]
MDKQHIYILNCEALKHGQDIDRRYEIQVAVYLKSHQHLDELINKTLKAAGYLFMYSGEAKPIIKHLEQASVYDQQAILLSQEISVKNPIAYRLIREIIDESQIKTAADFLHIEHLDNIEPLGRQVVVIDKKTVPDSLSTPLFASSLPSFDESQTPLFSTLKIAEHQDDSATNEKALKTYAVLDASKLDVFDGEHFIDGLAIKSLYTGKTARLYKRLAPYIVELKADHDFTRRLFTQAENDQQQPWYLYQQSAGIYIRSTHSLEKIWEHLRKLTRIWNPRSETWLQFRFYEPYWLQNILCCMTPAELSRFWGNIFDQIIVVKPLQKQASIIRVKASLSDVKATKIEMTERYEQALGAIKQQRYITNILAVCKTDLAEYSPVDSSKEQNYMNDLVGQAKNLGFKGEKEVAYFMMSAWLTQKQYPQWLKEKVAVLKGERSSLEVGLNLFEDACKLTGMKI